jgi:hypothetical protein
MQAQQITLDEQMPTFARYAVQFNNAPDWTTSQSVEAESRNQAIAQVRERYGRRIVVTHVHPL